MSRLTKDLSDEGLRDLIVHQEGLAVVAFLSWGSVPCDHFRPEFEAAAGALADWIRFWMVDAVENPTICANFNIVASPTTLLFRDGREIQRWEGPYSNDFLQARIREEIKRLA